MKQLTLLSSMLLLSGYGSDSLESPRDLSDALTFDELIEKRMNNDVTLNGSTVLINDELTASFESHLCQPVADEIPCSTELFSSEVSDPIFKGSNLGCKDGFYLSSELGNEVLNIALTEHTDFHLLNGEYLTAQANFYGEIEFVERSSWCSAQVNYGLTITLKQGEEAHLLNQFIN